MMTTDEMVREIRALYEAMLINPEVISETLIECGSELTSARHGSYGASAPTCTGALDALRGKLRAAASDALAEHEAKAETLRRALGIPSPAMAVDDLRAAVREWWAARRGLDPAAQVTTSITEASEACVRFDAADDALRDAMGGEL